MKMWRTVMSASATRIFVEDGSTSFLEWWYIKARKGTNSGVAAGGQSASPPRKIGSERLS
jgi:hypothetical protein